MHDQGTVRPPPNIQQFINAAQCTSEIITHALVAIMGNMQNFSRPQLSRRSWGFLDLLNRIAPGEQKDALNHLPDDFFNPCRATSILATSLSGLTTAAGFMAWHQFFDLFGIGASNCRTVLKTWFHLILNVEKVSCLQLKGPTDSLKLTRLMKALALVYQALPRPFSAIRCYLCTFYGSGLGNVCLPTDKGARNISR